MSQGYSAIIKKRRSRYVEMSEEMQDRAMQTLYGLHQLMIKREKKRGPKKRRSPSGAVKR